LQNFIILTMAASLLFISSGYAKNLEGVWELVSGEYINHEGNLVNYRDLNLKAIKIIKQNHFSFVTMSGDTFWGSGIGTIEYSDKQFTETPIFTSYQAPEGKEYQFDYELQGELWLTYRWEDNLRVEHEVWRRKE